VAPLIWGGTTSIVAQYVYFIFVDDRPRSLPRSLISQITRRLMAKSKGTSIDLDRKLDRSACVDRKSHFDRISIGIWNKRSPARYLENVLQDYFRAFLSRSDDSGASRRVRAGNLTSLRRFCVIAGRFRRFRETDRVKLTGKARPRYERSARCC
jgi:hypothetical protein